MTRRGERGQSTVEAVALLPVLAVAALAILQLLAAGAAQEYAGHSAEAGAVALLEGRSPARAAREALPSWSRRRVTVRVTGRRVHVEIRPAALIRRVGDLLTAKATADAGPKAQP